MQLINDDIFIIIPAYNEKLVIREVVLSLHAQDYKNIILIDDGSDQNIFEEIQDLHVHYLKHYINLGQGAALQTGFCYALKQGANICVTFDADGQHRAEDVIKLITPIRENKADIVLGSRFLFKKESKVPFKRMLVLKLARFVNFFFSGLLLSDAHNGLKALSKNVLEKIFLEENRMSHASEILMEVSKHKFRFLEVPVNIHYSAYTIQKGQKNFDSLKILYDLILFKLFK